MLIVQIYKLQSQITYSNNNQRYLQFKLPYFINMYTLFYSMFFFLYFQIVKIFSL